MKIGNWKTINWVKCAGIACMLWVILFLSTCIIGGIVDHYHPEWLCWLYERLP